MLRGGQVLGSGPTGEASAAGEAIECEFRPRVAELVPRQTSLSSGFTLLCGVAAFGKEAPG